MTDLQGLFVPLVTPFGPGGEVAADALEALAHTVLTDGARGLVALGTTGEPATLTPGERALVLEVCARVCAERGAPLIVGAGSNATADTRAALAVLPRAATAALVPVPYYLRPSADGVVAHFTELAAASPVPLLIYNIPYRTACVLDADTLVRLAAIPNIAGFKHSVGGVDATTVELLARVGDRSTVLAGDDRFAPALLALGGHGGILAAAHVATAEYAALVEAWRAGDLGRARALGNALDVVADALFAEPNPAVAKAVLAAQGRIPTPGLRLPLLPASATATERALSALDRLRTATVPAQR
ncbi:4-hydroxy-tetrahydrodipicolinate synthase [Nocardia thailandica]